MAALHDGQELDFSSWAGVYEGHGLFAHDASPVKAKRSDDGESVLSATTADWGRMISYQDLDSSEEDGDEWWSSESDASSEHARDAKVLAEQGAHTRAQARISETSCSRGWAMALESAMLEAVDTADFQDAMALLLRDCGADAASHLRGRESLCLAALKGVLPRYGFEATAEGLEEALQVVEALLSSELSEETLALYDCLGLAPPTARGSAPWRV